MALTEPSHHRASLEWARTVVAALDVIGLPAAVLAASGRPLALSSRLERLLPGIASCRQNRLQFADAAADRRLCEAAAQLAHSRGSERTRSIPVPAANGQPPIILHLISAHAAQRDLPADVSAILIAIPIVARKAPGADLLQALFNLTPAEARVAHAVAQRQTAGAIAASLGLSPETVRSQVKAALAKCGAARNIDLAVMLAGAALPGDPSAA
jgi:DNA-binding CsgD family transcriptional regulator